MGKRGPPPKPSAIKKRDGTYRKDRAAKNEMSAPSGLPTRPPFTDALARAEWDRVIAELREVPGLLTKIDRAALEGYCVNYASAVRYQKIADKTPIIETMFGPKVHPAKATALKSWALARQFAADFGMNPSARTRVGVPDKPPEDKAADFLFGAAPPQLQVVNGGRVDPIVRAPAGPVPASPLPAPSSAAEPEPEDGADD